MKTDELDVIVSTKTGFKSFHDLINAEGGYFPSIDCSDPEMFILANEYDNAQERINDPRRAYRHREPLIRPFHTHTCACGVETVLEPSCYVCSVSTKVKLTQQGVNRVLGGKEGDVFEVVKYTKSLNGGYVCHVIDRRYTHELTPDGQIWSIGPDGYTVI